MDKDKGDIEKYIRAKKRVDNLKNFYAHIVIYVIMSLLLFLFKGRIIDFFVGKGVRDEGFLTWMDWNFVFIPIIWGVVLLVIGIYHFRFKSGFIKKWEARQLRKYMEE
ncbi:2TM domain-containing protein [Arenibacter sp. F20364]|uniref:2TM domain-containing protein n=1 Tax=Arenibacter sp. F20364 TaxID=2926415 RepID=UPI001FF4053E|nr:2TM domain-containing protein [Arenibacter sp. F20364]MCK0190142.1 2TM domain-containing protein [Arenibacter sp. F20364]